MSEFRAWENKEFGKLNWIRERVSAVIGLPTILTASSYGVAHGTAIGAVYGGIGALSGAVLGGILGGALAFGLAAGFAIWVVPYLITLTLKLSRRVTSGDFEYRYNKHLARSEVLNDFDKLNATAAALCQLEAHQLLRYQESREALLTGLTETEKRLFHLLFTLKNTAKDPVRAINTNVLVAKLIDRLVKERTKSLRSNKKWALQILRGPKQSSSENIQTAHNVWNTVGPGKGPYHFFNLLWIKIFPKASWLTLPEEPKLLAADLNARLQVSPHLILVNPEQVVNGLRGQSLDSIEAFADKVIKEVAFRQQQAPAVLQREIDEMPPKQPLQKQFLESQLKMIKSWQHKKDLSKKPKAELQLYRAKQARKLHENQYSITKKFRIENKLSQIGHLVSQNSVLS